MNESARIQREHLEAVFEASQALPDQLVCVFDRLGRRLEVSASYARHLHRPRSQLIGTTLGETFAPKFARERQAVLDEVASAGRTVHTVEMLQGCRYVATAIPIECSEATDPAVIHVGRFTPGVGGVGMRQPWSVFNAADRANEAGAERLIGSQRPEVGEASNVNAESGGASAPVHLLATADWGRFRSIGKRQLEIMRLIATGRSNSEIAAVVHRTTRAVEWHVRRLNAIFGTTDRIGLLRIAADAGFALFDDAHWDRMLASHRPERAFSSDVPEVKSISCPVGSEVADTTQRSSV